MKKNFRYDSSYNSAKKQNIQEMVEHILDKKYGDTVSLGEVSKILGYNLDDEHEAQKFKSSMARVKNFLIDYGYILKTITNVGYYILKPKQIPSYTYRTYIVKPIKLLNKADRILKHTEIINLDEIRLKEFNEVNNLNKKLYNSIDKEITESDYYKNKGYYNDLND